MTRSIGASLPEDLLGRLKDDPGKNSSRVIIFSTVDDAGFPHHGMLSNYQVLAKTRGKILFIIYSESNSARNIRRNRVVTLLFVDEELSYYVKCYAMELGQKIEEAPNQSVFELTVKEALQDTSPTAKISSGINFLGLDEGISAQQRDSIFSRLKELAQK